MASDVEQPVLDPRVAICIAAFNRREQTLRCLRALAHSSLPDPGGYLVYLLDDASTDGTGAAVRAEFPDVEIVESPGNLYWAGGMRVAFGRALAQRHRWYLWMNDDVVPRPDAIARLIATAEKSVEATGRHALVTGAMWDPVKQQTSYAGYEAKSPLTPTAIRKVESLPDRPVSCPMLNANMLLIPDAIAERLGNIPAGYVHGLADWDYSLRARKAGFDTLIAPGYAGECVGNVPGRRFWFGPGMTLRERYRKMLHPLALPFRSRAMFLWRHFPLLAPIYMFSPYIKVVFDHYSGRAAKNP